MLCQRKENKMANSKNFKEKFVDFMSGKGFYAVLAVCLVGAGAAAWTAVDRTVDRIDENNKKIVEKSSSEEVKMPSWDFDEAEKTGKKKEDVKIENKESSSKPEEKSKEAEAKKEKKTESKEEKKEAKPNNKQSEKTLRPQPLIFVMPVEGNIIANFSNGKLVKDPTLNEWKTHNGVDIKAPVGANVVSAAEGKIEKIHKDKLWGNIIEISHRDGTVAFYCGVEPVSGIKEGISVSGNQPIGKVINIPCEISSEPHIHFAMKKENNWIDPLKHMGIER